MFVYVRVRAMKIANLSKQTHEQHHINDIHIIEPKKHITTSYIMHRKLNHIDLESQVHFAANEIKISTTINKQTDTQNRDF